MSSHEQRHRVRQAPDRPPPLSQHDREKLAWEVRRLLERRCLDETRIRAVVAAIEGDPDAPELDFAS